MNALVVGVGTIGRRHARNLRQMNPAMHIVACRTYSRNAVDLGDDAAVFDAVEYDLDSALGRQPELAVVATPASRHVDDALKLVRAGIHVFIEKPISHRLEGVQELIDESRRRSICLMVGYNLRFDSALRAAKLAITQGRIGRVLAIRAAVGQYLPDWRPTRDYRQTVSAQADLGGGPLLELSHEFDYVRWLAGDVRTVTARTARVGAFDIDVPEVADVILELEDGVLGSVHLDMLDRAPVRQCRILGTEGTIVWDALAHSATLFRGDSRDWFTLQPAAPGGDTYIRELEHYLACIADGGHPLVTGDDGLQAVRIATAAAESAESGRTVAL